MILPSLSRSDKIHPKTEKINPWRPEFENVLFDRRRSWKCKKRAIISYKFLVLNLISDFWTYLLSFETTTALKVQVKSLCWTLSSGHFWKNKLNPMHANERRRWGQHATFFVTNCNLFANSADWLPPRWFWNVINLLNVITVTSPKTCLKRAFWLAKL